MLDNKFILLLILSLLVSSCYTRKLKEGEYLLDKNKIITNNKEVNKDELGSIIRQKPNKKIFSVVKFHLMLHNMMDSAKVAERELKKIKRKNKHIVRKNKRRLNKNKELIPLKTSENFESFGEKILYEIGEKPSVLSENLASKSADQLHIYLIRKGFFNNTVRDSIHYIDKKFLGIKKKRAEVFYLVEVQDPYRIKKIEYASKDAEVLARVLRLSPNSKLKVGDIFDIDKMDDERERITNYLNNNGFYQFNKNYIRFFVDSTIAENEVSVKMQVDLFKQKLTNTDSVAKVPHSIFSIGSVYVKYSQSPYSKEFTDYSFKGIDFTIQGINDVNANLFYQSLFLRPKDIYSKQRQQQTFKKLVSLGIFESVNISTEIDTTGGENKLAVIIRVSGSKRKDVRTEGNATTSGSNFGIEGSLVFNHNNVFRGAEKFNLTLKGALESQPLFVNDNTNENSNIPIDFSDISSAFNTIEFGPEMSLSLPKLLFFSTYRFANVSNTRTVIKASLNYQRRLNQTRLDFERGIQEVSFGYSWNVNNKYSHTLEPLTFSAIQIDKSDEFSDRINNLNDQLLAVSFQNHIISASRYRFVYNSPSMVKRKRVSFYYDGSIESAGNILNAVYKITDQPRDANTNSFNIAGIQFAQYLKTQHDVRVYNKVNNKSSIVFRLLSGVGVPMENLREALPFQKSFFAGGTDKMRAWKARSLGPGSFRDSVLRFDKIGEILLEGNLEYRFDLLGFLDGALFVDAGNIWLMNEDSLRPGAEFKWNEFYKEIAIGAGFGIRVDLSFFLVRLDIAYPLKNPTLIEGERWFFQPKEEYNAWLNTVPNASRAPRLYAPQINIGIGYPF